jgi:hypothetical protein
LPLSSGGIKFCRDVLFGGSDSTEGDGDGFLLVSFSFADAKYKLNCELLADDLE